MNAPHFASLDEDGWTLEDGEEAHAAHPDTFWIPSRSEREGLAAGDLAKLRFRFALLDEEGEVGEESVERMWVEVEERVGSAYRGWLTNQPESVEEELVGMAVWFEPRHVINIITVAEQEERQGPTDEAA